MGKKVNPLIFRSQIYKNYKNNYFINIKNINEYIYINRIYIVLKYNLYKLNLINNNIQILDLNIEFFYNKFNIILFFINKYFNILYLKYIFIILSYLNYFYKHKYLFILTIKYINNINIYLINFYIKLFYYKYKSLKLIYNNLFNNILSKYNNIKGLKIKISGCFKNSLKTKTEIYSYGTLSLNTLNNKIKYNNDIINTKFGILGIKIWLNN